MPVWLLLGGCGSSPLLGVADGLVASSLGNMGLLLAGRNTKSIPCRDTRSTSYGATRSTLDPGLSSGGTWGAGGQRGSPGCVFLCPQGWQVPVSLWCDLSSPSSPISLSHPAPATE